MISNITINQLLSEKKENIIDLRNVQSYNNNHIPGAINIPFEQLIVNPSKYLNKNKIYYLYCRHGITSVKTCEILTRMGYNVVNIIGGYERWILEN